MFTSPLQSSHYVPAATGRNENWNKSQAVVQVYRPSQRKSKHLVEPIHTQLHPSEEKWFLQVIVPVATWPRHRKVLQPPHALAHRQGEEIVLLGSVAGQEWGKGKPKLPLPLLQKDTDCNEPASST